MNGQAGGSTTARWTADVRRAIGAAPPLDPAGFRRQETVLILLNLAVLVGLMSLHALFRPVVGRLTPEAGVAFSLRFLMQVGEAALLNRSGAWLTARRTWWYARLSILANVAFTAVLSRLSAGQESHYAVLMVIPVIAAAHRLSRAGLVVTLGLVVALTVAQVWVPVGPRAPAPSLGETFEATTVALIFVVVAVIVRLLGSQLWRKGQDLQRSLQDLAAARDRLVIEEKLAAVGRLASAVAHEIRNPVSMIASAVATARSPGTAPEVRGEVFDIVVHETRRLQRLTEDFLAYARPRPPQLRSTSLAETLGLTAGLVRARAGELGLTLEVAGADEAIALDPFQLHQALLNLAINAMEATPAGGRVRLAAAAMEAEAVFSVEDTGPSVPPEIAARLAEPFVTSKPGGTGLGLAIARGIAHAHGGELTLACNEPGRVRFELRVARRGGGST